jgi:arginase
MRVSRTVSLIGVPTDRNSSYLRGPAKAPPCIRAALRSEMGNPATELGGELDADIALADEGDLALSESAEDDALIEAAVARSLAAGRAPLLLGGDHSITLPSLRAFARVYPRLSILHIDAHPDLYHELLGNPRSHASPFARILEERLVDRLVQVGIRTMNAHQRQQVARFGVEVVGMRDFAPDKVPPLTGPLYVSIDLDGLDPAFAPGVSHHEPGGLSVRQVLDVLARLPPGEVVGGDVVELNPDRDLNGMTAVVAAKLAKELAALLAQRAATP